jgi:hypothetical protein
MSRDTRLMLGITLLTVPTIVYGGLTMLNIVSGGAYGTPGPSHLTSEQMAYYRAGHAHAGVLMILRSCCRWRSTTRAGQRKACRTAGWMRRSDFRIPSSDSRSQRSTLSASSASGSPSAFRH